MRTIWNTKEWRYYADTDTVHCAGAGIKTSRDLYALLHELGHAYYKHVPHQAWGGNFITKTDYNQEVEAWLWALKCVPQLKLVEATKFASTCLESYKAELESVWGIIAPCGIKKIL